MTAWDLGNFAGHWQLVLQHALIGTVALGEVQIGHQEEFLHEEGAQALQQATQGSGGVPILGGIQGTCGHDTKGCGLVTGLVSQVDGWTS